jgi:hypothetical protein
MARKYNTDGIRESWKTNREFMLGVIKENREGCKRRVQLIETGQIFNSLKELAKALNMNYKTLSYYYNKGDVDFEIKNKEETIKARKVK